MASVKVDFYQYSESIKNHLGKLQTTNRFDNWPRVLEYLMDNTTQEYTQAVILWFESANGQPDGPLFIDNGGSIDVWSVQ